MVGIDRDWPPIGRPCGSVERSNIKTKTFYERKTKPKPSPPEARLASRWSALQRWHTNRDSTKNETRTPIPAPQAHSWMLTPTGRISGVPVVGHASTGKQTK